MLATMALDHRLSAEMPRQTGGGGRVRYSRALLKATLVLMGCKARHAHKVPECLAMSLTQV